jgi:hypothetical protein
VETSICSKCGAAKTQAVAALGCQCPAGTIHLAGEADCGGTGCNCEKNVVGVRSNNGIAITNRAGLSDISNAVTQINNSITGLAGASYSADTLKKNVKEITVVVGTAVSYNFATKTITVGASATYSTVFNCFLDYLDEEGIVAVLNQFNKETYKHA